MVLVSTCQKDNQTEIAKYQNITVDIPENNLPTNAEINNIRAETKINTKVVENLEVEAEGMVKGKLGTQILADFEEIDCEGFMLFVDIEAFISVRGNMDINYNR